MADKHVEEVEFKNNTDPELAKIIVEGERKKSTFGLVIGLVCVLGGLALLYFGVQGSIDWTLEGLGLKSNLAKASPGALLFVVGVVIVWITRYSVKVT